MYNNIQEKIARLNYTLHGVIDLIFTNKTARVFLALAFIGDIAIWISLLIN